MSQSSAAGRGARILFLTPQVPSPTRQGAAIRNWNLMVQLAKTHELDLLTFSEPGEEGPTRDKQQRGDGALAADRADTDPAPLEYAGG